MSPMPDVATLESWTNSVFRDISKSTRDPQATVKWLEEILTASDWQHLSDLDKNAKSTKWYLLGLDVDQEILKGRNKEFNMNLCCGNMSTRGRNTI